MSQRSREGGQRPNLSDGKATEANEEKKIVPTAGDRYGSEDFSFQEALKEGLGQLITRSLFDLRAVRRGGGGGIVGL
jgi:hypothetical protein